MEVKNRRVAEVFKNRNMKIPYLLAMLCKEGVLQERGHAGEGSSDLSTLFLNLVQDCAKGRLGKATVQPGLFIILVSQT